MHWKGANRLYSKQTLSRWCGRLEFAWEERFSHEVLAKGRSLYKRGTIKEISLGDEDAIMTCKIGKSESYSVVEWDNGRFKVRSSAGDAQFANAIAVAGFLEIEELIADEELELIEAAGEIEADAQKDEPAPEESESGGFEDAIDDGRQRMLHLALDTHYRGIICQAYWISDDGSRAPALGADDGSPNARNGAERERLITLAARSRKSHFNYAAEFNGYLLENLNEVPFFVSNVWPQWKESFSAEESASVLIVQAGLSEVEVKAKAKLGRDGKLDVDWVFERGGQLLSPEDAAAVSAGGGATILARDHGVIRLSSASRKLLEEWSEISATIEGERLEPYRLFSLFPESSDRLELDGALKKWRNRLENTTPQKLEMIECMRPYQKEGALWMDRLHDVGCHGMLADEMGLGKTLQVIALTRHALAAGKKALIVCPSSVVPVWISEFAKFDPRIKAVAYAARTDISETADWDALVISFALLRTRIEKMGNRTFDYAIIDEVQFIKNPDAKSTRACLRIKAERRIALTGTPIENRPLDIWSAFQFLMPGLLGHRSDFEKRFKDNPGAFKGRLRAQISPFLLRRTKSQVAADLPEKIVIEQKCPLTKLQSSEYARICAAGLEKIGGNVETAMRKNRFAMLSLLTRLRQASCDPQMLPWVEASLEDSGKLKVLLEKLLEILGTGHKVVIFSQFVRFLIRAREMISATFPDLPLFEITGATRDRQAQVEGFQNSEETAVMLVSLKAGGTGITLHAADYVFLLDPWWNPAVESQAIDRVHRIGQKNTVFVYRLISEGTIEERIQELQREKRALFESIVRDSEAGLDQLAQSFKTMEALLLLSRK